MQADHSSDACTCRVCLGEWPEPEASISSAEIVSIATGETLRGIYEPNHIIPRKMQDAITIADRKLAVFRGREQAAEDRGL
jgi:hypothetical protein